MRLLVRVCAWMTLAGVLGGVMIFAPSGPLAGPTHRALAANVDIVLNGDPDDLITLNLAGAGCPNNMAAGESCTATVAITNDSSTFALDYTAAAVITLGAECDGGHSGPEFTALVNNFVDTTDHPGTDDVRHMPKGSSDSERFDVVVKLDANAGNPCQGASATVQLTVDAFEDTIDPQNRTDIHIGSHACDGPFDKIIIGSPAADTLKGGSGRNQIIGNGGNDTIIGGPKEDCIITLGGNDNIDGGEGNDEIRAGDGTNTVAGKSGNDTIIGGTGNDTVSADEGTDYVDGLDGANNLRGGPHNDVLQSGAGNDTLNGESGTDGCDAGGGTNTVVACEY